MNDELLWLLQVINFSSPFWNDILNEKNNKKNKK